MPFDRLRARSSTPRVLPASEPSLRRPEARELTRVSLLVVARGDATALPGRLRGWLERLSGRAGEMLVVDDGVVPGGADIAARLAAADDRVRPILLKPSGYGVALRSAIERMRGDIALVVPADAAPADLALDPWLRPIQRGDADAVVSTPAPANGRPATSPGERASNWCLRRWFGWSPSDGWRPPLAVRADVLRHLRLTSRGEDILVELMCRLAQWQAKVREASVDSNTAPRHATLLRDGWRIFRCRTFDTQFTTHAGFYILTAVAHADRYNRWIVDQVRPFLGERVLEAGAGIGNLSQLFGDCRRLVLAEREQVYVDRLRDRFADDERVRVLPIDLTVAEDVEACATERLDTVFCSNVLEHLEPDEQVLRSFASALQPGGHCILVVPAGERLYTGIDAELGHFRRYEPDDLARKLAAAGLEVVFQRRFSRLGALGWAISGHLLRRRTLSPRQMIWFDRLLPVAKLLEYVLPAPGMSLIMVGRKPLRPALPQQRRAA